MRRRKIETATELAEDQRSLAELLEMVFPGSSRRSARRAEVLAHAPPEADGWQWLAHQGDDAAATALDYIPITDELRDAGEEPPPLSQCPPSSRVLRSGPRAPRSTSER